MVGDYAFDLWEELYFTNQKPKYILFCLIFFFLNIVLRKERLKDYSHSIPGSVPGVLSTVRIT